MLLGDAAWCLTLFAAPGASLALTGADLLGAALARHPDVPTALTAWETELRASTLPPVARILQRQLRLHR